MSGIRKDIPLEIVIDQETHQYLVLRLLVLIILCLDGGAFYSSRSFFHLAHTPVTRVTPVPGRGWKGRLYSHNLHSTEVLRIDAQSFCNPSILWFCIRMSLGKEKGRRQIKSVIDFQKKIAYARGAELPRQSILFDVVAFLKFRCRAKVFTRDNIYT